MLAIAGYVGAVEKDSGILNNMLDAISSFADGEASEFISENCAIGQKQLSDKFGIRPAQYYGIDGRAIVFNGEIYNYNEIKSELGIELTANDASELVLRGYEQWGKDICKKLEGMFAFAIWDEDRKELFIARDGWGIKPIYFYCDGDTFIFASRIKAFPEHSGFKKEFNDKLLSAFLCFGSTPTSETLFKNVYRLEAGHYLTFKDGKIKKEKFFGLEFKAEEKKNIEGFADEIHESALRSIKRQTDGQNFATFLSGGVDSSYMAALAMPKVTFTAGYANAQFDESVYSKELADKLGIENKVKTVTPEEYIAEFEKIVECMDEPLANPSVTAIYLGAAEAAKETDILLSGEGADELFGGYNSYKEELTHKGYMKLPYPIRHFIYLVTAWIPSAKFDFFARRGQLLKDYHIGLDRVFKDKEAQAIIKCGNQMHTKEAVSECYERYNGCSTLKQRQAIDYYFWLINDFIHCVVRAADGLGIEARFPFLCGEIYDIAMKLPDEYKLNNETTKRAFRLAAQRAVPTDAHKRKKLGFPVPLKEWIKSNGFYSKIKEKFESETAERFFRKDEIMKLLEDHRSGKRDCYKKVWTIYTFLVWYDIYFK